MNTPTEQEYPNKEIIVMLQRIEERIKKIEKRTKEIFWFVWGIPVAAIIGWWLVGL